MAVCNACNPTLRSHTLLCSFFFFYFVITFYYFTLHANALSFNLTNVNQMPENVTITGDAIFSNDGIQITPNEVWKVGRATYKDEFHLGDKASGTLTDFNTSFLFAIDSEGSSDFADGFTFFLISHDSPSSFARASYLGLPKEPPLQNPFVTVEFDTFPNEWDPLETHVGININSFTSSATATWYNNITYGKNNKAWISYDSSSKNLSVVFTGYTNNTSVKSVLSYPVDLRDYLPEWVTIGFSAGTGDYSEKHIIKSWSFNSSPNLSPSLRNKKPLVVGLTVGSFGLVCGLALFVFVFVLWMKRTDEEVAFNMSMDNDFEVDILSDDDDDQNEPENDPLSTPFPIQSKRQRTEPPFSNPTVLLIDDDHPTPLKRPSFVPETLISPFSNFDVAIVKCIKAPSAPHKFSDGFTFLLISHDSPSSLTRAGYLGLPKEPPSQNQFVAVEFDTYPNDWDPPETHVGININSLTSSATATWYNNITYGKDNKAWISYDSSSKNLSVVFTGYTNNTSVKSVLSYPIDLRNYLPEWVTIGFSAGTGKYSEKHIIKSWSFNSSPNLSPSLRNKKPLVVGLTVGSFGLVCGLALFVFVFVLWMKRTDEEVAFNMSMDNHFELTFSVDVAYVLRALCLDLFIASSWTLF
ncbi:hypothetical protein LOK49_LG12G02003 [Camellia lanceoleosa]|uniref:Uncharacterized protein n=1 Tax=Camellia lanceoleosa TaxID=1840588 RepID=A0ACC0FNZ8_9ERIC|nr:hypothetical protein LOK49_LG12G02003 [Camellia lanceoleosa]